MDPPTKITAENTFKNCFRIIPDLGENLEQMPIYSEGLVSFLRLSGAVYLLASDMSFYISGVPRFFNFCVQQGVELEFLPGSGYNLYSISDNKIYYNKSEFIKE